MCATVPQRINPELERAIKDFENCVKSKNPQTHDLGRLALDIIETDQTTANIPHRNATHLASDQNLILRVKKALALSKEIVETAVASNANAMQIKQDVDNLERYVKDLEKKSRDVTPKSKSAGA